MRSLKNTARLPPGPRTPVLWQTYRIVVHPVPYVRQLRARYGDVFSFHSLAGRGIATCDPVLAKEIFSTSPETFRPPSIADGIFGTHSVIASWGATHKKQRRLLNPHFHGARIKAMLATMGKVVRERFEATPKDRIVSLTDVTQNIALDIILEAIFGEANEADRARGRVVLREMVHGFSPAIAVPTFQSRFVPMWRRYVAARAAFDAWVDDVIAARRRRNELGDDLLGLFLATKYDDGSPMADGEIRDQLVTLLLAGHETSATAIAWAAYWLQRTPKVLARLRSEVTDTSPDALVKNAYLGAVCSETLRIEPIVTDLARVCNAEYRLGPWTLAKDEIACVLLGGILKHPRVFPEPDEFRPERFLERQYTASEFLPFGGGPRRCLGAAFAEAEMAIAVGILATEWDLELTDKRPERGVRRNITMGPERGVRVRFSRARAKSTPRAA